MAFLNLKSTHTAKAKTAAPAQTATTYDDGYQYSSQDDCSLVGVSGDKTYNYIWFSLSVVGASLDKTTQTNSVNRWPRRYSNPVRKPHCGGDSERATLVEYFATK